MAERFWLLRVLHGVRHSFPMRWLEWVMAVTILAWGDNFLGVQVTPNSTRSAWYGMTFYAPTWFWAWLMIAFGVLRLAALAINGTFRETIYSQYSPLIRGATSGLCGVLWFFVALSSLSAGTQSGVVYPAVFIIEAFIAYFVLGEAGDNMKAHIHGRSRPK